MKLVSMSTIGALAIVLVGCQSGYPQTSSTVAQAQVHSPTPRGSEAAATVSMAPARSQSVVKTPVEPGPDSVLTDIRREAIAALKNEQWQSSIALAEQGLRIDRRQASFYLILSESYLALGDAVQAQRFADQASRLCGRDCRESERLQKKLRLPK
jgi:hypothetical protein